MTSELLPYLAGAFASAVAAITVGVTVAMAVRSPALQSATVDPFGPARSLPAADPANDTISSEAQVNTVFVTTGWQTATLSRLCDVEDLLDSLEAHGVPCREVHTLANSTFCVRWK